MAEVARLQRGRVARRQLREAGVSDSAVDRLVAKGQLHREHPGVYAVGHPGDAPLARETAALLACGQRTLLSHLTAAELWHLLPSGSASGALDVTIAGRQTGNPLGVKVHRTRRLHTSEVRVRERLPVTSPARTLLDIAEQLTERALELALDEGLQSGIVRVNQIRDVIARNPGRHAGTILTALLEARTGSTISRSEAEDRMLELIRAAQLPPVEMNVRLLGFKADFLWREQRVVLEVDGYRYHSSKSAFERDRRKDAAFRAAGWDVIRVSRNQVVHDPFFVVALVAAALAKVLRRSAA